MSDTEPTIVQKRGIDITPYEHGIWCSIAGGKPFVNEVAVRRWDDDGEHIWLMLESHNFMKVHEKALVGVVEIGPPSYETPESKARRQADDAERMRKRPPRRVWVRAPQEDLP